MTLTGNSLKTIVITNIVALMAAVASLIWNAAVLTTQFEEVKVEQVRQGRVVSGINIEQQRILERIGQNEQAAQLLDSRIFRLEDLQLSR